MLICAFTLLALARASDTFGTPEPDGRLETFILFPAPDSSGTAAKSHHLEPVPTPQVRKISHIGTPLGRTSVDTGPTSETAESVASQLKAIAARTAVLAHTPQFPCRRIPASDRVWQSPRALTVLAHIGLNGRILDAELLASTGRTDVDRAIAQCALAWGAFPLAIIDGRVTESVQEIEWPEDTPALPRE